MSLEQKLDINESKGFLSKISDKIKNSVSKKLLVYSIAAAGLAFEISANKLENYVDDFFSKPVYAQTETEEPVERVENYIAIADIELGKGIPDSVKRTI